RNTKDLDLYVLPKDRACMVQALSDAGLEDYFEKLPYDRGWIHRGIKDDAIVDVIWRMANRRTFVDERWIFGGAEAMLRGERWRVLPVEEFVWAKLYVMQPDRCDWQDVFNVLSVTGDRLDWDHLLGRLGEDRAVLSAALQVYAWVCPRLALRLPSSLWKEL